MNYVIEDLDSHARPVGAPLPTTLADFIAANAEWLDQDPDAMARILALRPGQAYIGGGGAAASFALRRVA